MMARFGAFIRKAAIVLLVLYLVLVLLLYVFQRNFLFHPDQRPILPAEAGLADFEAVAITPVLKSWWRAPPTKDAPVILYFHGNGGALAGRSGIFAEMAGWGAGVLGVGYPGYGGNPGQPNEADIHRAAQANYDWLIKQGIDPKRIVITAHSMGTGAAVPLAAKNKAAGLILESPFTSMAETAQLVMPFVPAKWMVHDSFRSAAHIAKVKMPVVWMHGTADQLIPYAMGERLLAQVRGPKCTLRIDGGDHDHLWNMGVAAFTQRQAFAMARTGACDGRTVILEDGKLRAP
jgi:acetyl esterase/lipase